MYELIAISGNSQRLDGGSMFGNVPKALWKRWVDADENNNIALECRALLVLDKKNDKKILLETGIGAFFEPKLKERYGVVGEEHALIKNLNKIGISEDDIDFIILSHLHFDHAGGLLSEWRQGEESELLFPNAKYIVSERAWERANNPHWRDKASFIPKLNELLLESGRLITINEKSTKLLGEDFSFIYSDGHTPGLMITEIKVSKGSILFVSDLIPATPWVHLPITMGYDRFPEQVINEKKELLEYALNKDCYFFYTHDPKVPASKISVDSTGKYSVKSDMDILSKVII